jgi:hypothetical protein
MQVIPWDHKRIERPGWYSGIPLELYHSADICAGLAVSSSDLRACWSKSPAHMYLNWAENPKREVRETTSAMLLGACAHHLLLGEENFKLKYIAQPETYRDRTTAAEKPWNNNSGFCRGWNDKQRREGRVVVPLTDDDLARGRKQNRAMLRKITGCIDTGHWPGPGEGDLTPLPLSHDERTRIDERLRWEGLS